MVFSVPGVLAGSVFFLPISGHLVAARKFRNTYHADLT
jgi:hypothetical protein